MQGQKREVDERGQLPGLDAPAHFGNDGVLRFAAQLAQALEVELHRHIGARQRRYRRVKIPDGALVNKLPVEQNEVAATVNKHRYGLEEGLIEVVVYRAATRKTDFPLTRRAAEEDAYFHTGAKVRVCQGDGGNQGEEMIG